MPANPPNAYVVFRAESVVKSNSSCALFLQFDEHILGGFHIVAQPHAEIHLDHFHTANFPSHCPAICEAYFRVGIKHTSAATGVSPGTDCP